MELIGTLLLTLAVAGGDPMAVGLVFMAILYYGSHISGGHYNPAVTTAVFVRGKMDLLEALKYILAQIVGALLALWLYAAATGNVFSHEAAVAGSTGMAVFMEGLLAVVFVWIVLQMNMSKRYKGNMVFGFVIGLTLTAVMILGGKVNPALSASVLLNDAFKGIPMADLNHILVYVISPLVGGAVAAGLFQYLNPTE